MKDEIKSNLPLTKHTEYTFSMIDNLEAPTEELTLHYRVWDSVDPFFVNRKVASLKNSMMKLLCQNWIMAQTKPTG